MDVVAHAEQLPLIDRIIDKGSLFAFLVMLGFFCVKWLFPFIGEQLKAGRDAQAARDAQQADREKAAREDANTARNQSREDMRDFIKEVSTQMKALSRTIEENNVVTRENTVARSSDLGAAPLNPAEYERQLQPDPKRRKP